MRKSFLVAMTAMLLLVVTMIFAMMIMSERHIKKDKASDADVAAVGEDATPVNATSLDATPTDADVEVAVVVSPEEQYISELMDDMTIEEKVAQMFLVACPTGMGDSVQTEYQFGGYLLFGRDFEDISEETIVSMISSYQDASKIPMVIAVDEEGGTVCRVSSKYQLSDHKFRSPRSLYQEGGLDKIEEEEILKAELLHKLGINVNLAPVCDIATSPYDFMYDRSLGESPEVTGDFVALVVKTNSKHHMGTVLKHFPGYGNNTDTHSYVAVDDREIKEFKEGEFKVFKAGFDAGCGSVLVSHNIVNCMDDEMPASLSPKVHNIIRDDFGFDGVIMTDDLSMSAVKHYADTSDVAVLAVLAGNDMLCCQDYKTSYDAVLAAYYDGTISEDRINESVYRILMWKVQLGIIQVQ